MDTSTTKEKLSRLGRAMALLFNRSMMYQKSHPMVKGSVKEVHAAAEALFFTISPLVFILNREQFYIDEEPLDPRINVKRITTLFKNHGIQSISFETGLAASELDILVDILSAMTGATDAAAVKKDLYNRGVYNIKVNHVRYKKVTEDDQVVSRDALKNATWAMEAEDSQHRRKFMDTLFETILTEEFANTLNIRSLLANPAMVSRNMIAADQAGAERMRTRSANSGTAGAGPGGLDRARATGGIDIRAGSGVGSDTNLGPLPGGDHGPVLLHQLELIQKEVENHMQGAGRVSMEALANAVFEMKKQLFEDIQTQKALGIAYANEAAIVGNINELADQVLLKLIREEYRAGKITTQRLAQIVLRLIPQARDLKRLMPQIKTVLLESGMPAEDYLNLVEALQHELQNEALSRIIEESSETIGVDSDDLIDELKENPGQAAKLIYLAAQLRKGTGDESALADILVDYVEQMGSQAAKTAEGAEGDAHLKKVITQVESTILQQLGKLDVGDDVLLRMEERINSRMDSIMDKMRVEWLNARAGGDAPRKPKRLSVLQTLEHSVGEDEELDEILKTVRSKVEAGEIGENDFSQIQAEIDRQKKRLQNETEGVGLPAGVLASNELIFIIEKEIARAQRYHTPFSALAFSFVNAKPKARVLKSPVTAEVVMAAALEKLASTIRQVDYIGRIGRNRIVALLPMSDHPAAKKALSRMLGLLHGEPLQINAVPVQLRVAAVALQYDAQRKLSAQAFAKQLSNQLMDMVSRVKSIQVLF